MSVTDKTVGIPAKRGAAHERPTADFDPYELAAVEQPFEVIAANLACCKISGSLEKGSLFDEKTP